MEEITIDEYIATVNAELVKFKARWERGLKEEPQHFSASMPVEEWEEQFLAFINS